MACLKAPQWPLQHRHPLQLVCRLQQELQQVQLQQGHHLQQAQELNPGRNL